ncbi:MULTISPECIES: class C sortase [unclassified Ruminococcus]|uniref:class C sortase n=1 Tax=unclassified Ruminococcus TaxID=2608920 RepID=UPI00210BDEA4|nr:MULTISPECIES: class C sortase [unclassified Ruminococcus]MCQ4023368.1 class C sortase [Ruminococcus sp. zg-924]MCQ4115735.1 class C sortase [Ruminococcus sp. zg-921]
MTINMVVEDNMESKEKEKRKLFNIIFNTVIILVFLAGIALLTYPSLGNMISCVQQQHVVDEYQKQVSKMLKKDLAMQKQLAIDYNNSLDQITLQDPFSEEEPAEVETTEPEQSLDEYFKALSINSENMMGYIKIPKISISIPIYHDATEVQLQKGIGHLRGTSLPIGGIGTHCVLSGHTGVPGNMLFTDLDKLENGDRFYLHVLDEVLAYRVVSVEVVEPDDTSKIQIDPKKDLCTLLTCTPYGINSHRLLVTGERTTYTPGEDEEDVEVIEVTDAEGNVVETMVLPRDYFEIFGLKIPNWVVYTLIPVVALLIILVFVIIVRRRLRKTREKKE